MLPKIIKRNKKYQSPGQTSQLMHYTYLGDLDVTEEKLSAVFKVPGQVKFFLEIYHRLKSRLPKGYHNDPSVCISAHEHLPGLVEVRVGVVDIFTVTYLPATYDDQHVSLKIKELDTYDVYLQTRDRIKHISYDLVELDSNNE